jgi:hypothetical protein
VGSSGTRERATEFRYTTANQTQRNLAVYDVGDQTVVDSYTHGHVQLVIRVR